MQDWTLDFFLMQMEWFLFYLPTYVKETEIITIKNMVIDDIQYLQALGFCVPDAASTPLIILVFMAMRVFPN